MVKPPHLRLQNAALRELLEGIQVVPQSARKRYWILWCCERWKNMGWSGWSYKGANLCCRSYIALSMLNIERWPVSSIFNIPHHQIHIFNIQKANQKSIQKSPAISSPLQPQLTRFSPTCGTKPMASRSVASPMSLVSTALSSTRPPRGSNTRSRTRRKLLLPQPVVPTIPTWKTNFWKGWLGFLFLKIKGIFDRKASWN